MIYSVNMTKSAGKFIFCAVVIPPFAVIKNLDMYRILADLLCNIAHSVVVSQKSYIVIRQVPPLSTVYFPLPPLYFASVPLFK